MDPDARMYQDQLHEANQKRMERIEDKLDLTLTQITEVGVAVRCLPDHEERISNLEKDHSFRKGVIAVLLLLGSAAGAGLNEVFKAIFHQILGK